MNVFIEVNTELSDGSIFPALLNIDNILFVEKNPITGRAIIYLNDSDSISIQTTSLYEDIVQVLSLNEQAGVRVLKCKFDPIKEEEIDDIGCDRNLCTQNEYNNIDCKDCIVNKKKEE